MLTRLLDEAEEQETCETILAYYFLWRYAGAEGWPRTTLEKAIEGYLEERSGRKVEFEIRDALAKLESLHVIQTHGDRCSVVPIEKALEMLDATWDNFFNYARTLSQTRPVV